MINASDLPNVNADDLRNFRTCELLYDYRKLQGLEPLEYTHPRFQKQIEYEATIKKIASFFFYKKQAYSEPSYQALLNRWQKLWFSADTTATDIMTAQHEIMWDNEASYTSQAAMALLDFYEDFAGRPHEQVMLSDERFNVPLGRDVVLEGVFDLVLRTRDSLGDKYTIYKWSGVHKRPPSNYWSFDFAIMDYAFRYRNDFKPVNVEYRLWDFGSAKPGIIHYETSDHDFNNMKHWATKLIRTKVFVPRRGLITFCKQCPYDEPCSKWKFPEDA